MGVTFNMKNDINLVLNIYAKGGKDSSCVREFFKDKMTCVCQVILSIYQFNRLICILAWEPSATQVTPAVYLHLNDFTGKLFRY